MFCCRWISFKIFLCVSSQKHPSIYPFIKDFVLTFLIVFLMISVGKTYVFKSNIWKRKQQKNQYDQLVETLALVFVCDSVFMCQRSPLVWVWLLCKFISITFSLFILFHSEGTNSFWSFHLWLRKLNSNRLQSQKKLLGVRAASNC